MISPNDISVVVQGAVAKEYTGKCLQRIRSLLPDAQLILSTWEGADVDGLTYDDLVMSNDPGGEIVDFEYGTYNNVNRQIVGVKKGLQKATRKYTLKFRTDLFLISVDFLKYFGAYDTETHPPQYFSNRILICDFYTRNPRVWPIPFHPSDWVAFGTSADLAVYFDAPLQPDEFFRWFSVHEKECNIFTGYLSRYTPEQYICISFLRTKEELVCDNYYDTSHDNVARTESFFAHNMVVLNYRRQFRVRFLKYNPNRRREGFSLISHKRWKLLYRHYVLGKTVGSLSKNTVKIMLRHKLRSFLIRILDILHLKNWVKSILKIHRSR